MNISVIIPIYNAERFLEKAVTSALQFEEVKEILLIEDQSPDSSLEICKHLVQTDSRIKLFQHPDKGNHGAGASRNVGLEKATQEFVAFLDADDYYLPNRFEAEKEIFKDERIDGVFGALGTEFLSEKGKKEFKEKFKETILTTVEHPAQGNDVFFGLIGMKEGFGLFFHLNTLTVKKAALKNNDLKFNESLEVHQDMDFIIKLSYYSNLKTGNITEAIAIRGIHNDNRITKIKQYSSLFYKNIFKLYDSLYNWSNEQKAMDKRVRKIIKLRYLSFKNANKIGLSKKTGFIIHSILNPEMLKTRYRFHALNKHTE